jgi:hypothetical protein
MMPLIASMAPSVIRHWKITNDALPVLSEGFSEFAEEHQSTARGPLTAALEKLWPFAAQ